MSGKTRIKSEDEQLDTSTDSRWSTLIVKSKILPIVSDIPVKTLMPNLFQLYQKTLLEKLFLTGFFGVYE